MWSSRVKSRGFEEEQDRVRVSRSSGGTERGRGRSRVISNRSGVTKGEVGELTVQVSQGKSRRLRVGSSNPSGVRRKKLRKKSRKKSRDMVRGRIRTGWWVGKEWCHRSPKASAALRCKCSREEGEK